MTESSAKAKLRARMRALRQRLARENPDAACAAARLASLDRFQAGLVVAGYHPQGAELDPAPLLKRLVAELAAVIVYPAGASHDGPLVFRVQDPDADPAVDVFGVPCPAPGAAELAPDLVIAPLLAFDSQGGRLGQGKGAYDRTIEQLRADGRVFVLGLAYRGQEIDQVPGEPHDQSLDAILTETGYREVR